MKSSWNTLHASSLVPTPLSEKSRRGLATVPYSALSQRNSISHATTCLYAVKIEGVHSCMACMIEQILIMSVRQRGTSLGVKTAVTIHQQATFTSRSLARDRKAAKVTGGHVCFIARTITRYVGTERSDRPVFMRKTCFSPFKPYLQLRQTLLSNIYALEMHPWQKRYCSWSEN